MKRFDLYPHRLSIYPSSRLASLLWLAASLRQVCDSTGVSSLNSVGAGEKHACVWMCFGEGGWWGEVNSLTSHIKDWKSPATGVKCILFGIRNQRHWWKNKVLTCKWKVVSLSQSLREWKRRFWIHGFYCVPPLFYFILKNNKTRSHNYLPAFNYSPTACHTMLFQNIYVYRCIMLNYLSFISNASCKLH